MSDHEDEAIDGGPLPPDVPFFTPDGKGVTLKYVAHLRSILGLRRGQSLVGVLTTIARGA
jgi:hypothetical protein